jgi:hypothetical protein
MRTGAQFVSHFGENASEGAPRRSPLCPDSQRTQSRSGFRFNLTHVGRHPRSNALMTANPLVDVARQCVDNDTMFIDPDFPPSQYSLLGQAALDGSDDGASSASSDGGVEATEVVWRRLSEAYFRPRLQNLGAKAVDIKPGAFTPPWLPPVLTALQAAAEFDDMISPGDDGWIYGAFVVRLFIEGRWCFVLVDDFVPCDGKTGEPLSCSSAGNNSIFYAVLEKAIAKCLGSFDKLKYPPATVTLPRMWQDVTGNMAEVIAHDQLATKEDVCSNLCDIVMEEFASCSVHAQVRPVEEVRFAGHGFEEGTLWVVDAVHEVNDPVRHTVSFLFHVARGDHIGEPVRKIELLREHFVEGLSPDDIANLPETPRVDVSYWMTSSDYFVVFSHTYCLRVLNNFQKASFVGSFAGRPEAGGKMLGIPRLLRNPQIMMSFVQPTECVVQLQLLDRRLPGSDEPPLSQRVDGHSLQLHALKGKPVERPIESDGSDDAPVFLAASSLIDVADDADARNDPSVSLRLTLPGGNYIIIPTLGGGSTEHYVVTIFSVSAFYIKLLN